VAICSSENLLFFIAPLPSSVRGLQGTAFFQLRLVYFFGRKSIQAQFEAIGRPVIQIIS